MYGGDAVLNIKLKVQVFLLSTTAFTKPRLFLP